MMIFSDWWEYGVLWAWAAAGACVRVSVCVRLHYVHWWPDCDIIWTYLALFRCSAVFRLSRFLAPGNSLLLSAHYRDLMRRNHHRVHTSHTSLFALFGLDIQYLYSTSHMSHHSHQYKCKGKCAKIIGYSGTILRLLNMIWTTTITNILETNRNYVSIGLFDLF